MDRATRRPKKSRSFGLFLVLSAASGFVFAESAAAEIETEAGGVRGDVGDPGSPTNCELAQNCCGMENRQCCQNGGQTRCYPVWRRECKGTTDTANCRLKVNRQCIDVAVRDCRIVTEVEYRDFETRHCVAKPTTKCFRYEKKSCSLSTRPQTRNVTWDNERLTQSNDDVRQRCWNVRTHECQDRVEPQLVTNRVLKQRKVQNTRRRCLPVQTTVRVPVVRIAYRQMCYDFPQVTCDPQCVATASCAAGQAPCALNLYSTNTVCPMMTAGPRTPCHQVQQPVCQAAGTPCLANQQRCCRVQTRRVCRQIPQRVVQQVTRTVGRGIPNQLQCADIPIEDTQLYYDTEERVVNRTRKDCDAVTKRICHNFTIPRYEKTIERKSEVVTVNLPTCEPKTETATYCHNFATGEVECRNRTVRRGFKINKIKCDKSINKPMCTLIPIPECQVQQGSTCQYVKREVCVDACSADPMCATCDSFRKGAGFASCPGGSCGSYYPSEDFGGQHNSSSDVGTTTGIVNGVGREQEYFPGAAGSVYYPGTGYLPTHPSDGSVGERYYPGVAGTYNPGGVTSDGDGGYFQGRDAPVGDEGGAFSIAG